MGGRDGREGWGGGMGGRDGGEGWEGGMGGRDGGRKCTKFAFNIN